jgi:glycosyltransferase involved in cell wall biosynthesis
MGGAEKWINDTAKHIRKHEDALLVSVDQSIANIYGNLVLKRAYDSRVTLHEIENHTSLVLSNFIPFTEEWNTVRDSFNNSRLIYARFELLEFLLIVYFGGLSALNRTVFGLHSPFIYSSAQSFFEKLHNVVYGSDFSKKLFKTVKKVHVLNTRDEKFLKSKWKLNNVVYVPNGTTSKKFELDATTDKKNLHVLFVGELSLRKGIDRLIDIIKKSPSNYIFTIVGDGVLKKDIEILSGKFKNVVYMGYQKNSNLYAIYKKNDVIILPSRAESMSLVALEGLSYGLTLVSSLEASLNLNNKIEFTCKDNDDFIITLNLLFKKKKLLTISESEVKSFFNSTFSNEVIYPKLLNKVFEIA